MQRVWFRFLYLLRWFALALIFLVLLSQYILNLSVVRTTVLEHLNETLPGTISFRDHSFSLLRRSLTLYDPVLLHPEGDTLLSADTVGASLRVRGLLHNTVQINTLHLGAPRVTLSFWEDGSSTLYEALGIEPKQDDPEQEGLHVLLRQGTVTRGRLSLAYGESSLSLQNLSAQVYANSRDMDFSGTISLKDMDLHHGEYTILLDSLYMAGDMVEKEISHFHFYGREQDNFISLMGDLSGVFTSQTPRGELFAETSLQHSFIDPFLSQNIFESIDISLSAEGSIPRLTGALDVAMRGTAESDIDTAHIQGHLAESVFTVEHLWGQFFSDLFLTSEGTVSLSGSRSWPGDFSDMGSIAELLTWEFQGRATDSAQRPVTPDLTLSESALDFTLAGQGTSFPQMSAQTALRGRTTLSSHDGTQQDIQITTALDKQGSRVEIDSADIRFSSAAIGLGGSVDLARHELDIKTTLSTLIIEEHLPFLTDFGPLFGSVMGDLTVRGPWNYPEVVGVFTAHGLQYDRYGVDFGDLDFIADFSTGEVGADFRVQRDSTFAETSVGGQFFTSKGFSLRPDFSWDASVGGEVWLADVSDDFLDGRVSFSGEYGGVALRGDGDVQVESDMISTPWITLYDLFLPVHISDNTVEIAEGTVVPDSAGTVAFSGTANLSGDVAGRVWSESFSLGALSVVSELPLWADLSFDLLVDSTLDDPYFSLNADAADIRVHDVSIPQKMSLALGGTRDTLTYNLTGPLSLSGGYTPEGSFSLAANIDTFSLNELLAVYGASAFHGNISASVEARGREHSLTDASVEIGALRLFHKEQEERNIPDLIRVENQHLSYAADTIFWDDFHLRLDTTSDLYLSGMAAMPGDIRVRSHGEIPLSLVRQFDMAEVDSLRGSLAVDVTSRFDGTTFGFDGDILGEDISFFIPYTNQRVHSLHTELQFRHTGEVLSDIHGRIGRNGVFSLGGTAQYEGMRMMSGGYDIRARSIPLVVPGAAEVVVNTQSRLSFDRGRMSLAGTIDLLEGYYFEDIDFTAPRYEDELAHGPRDMADEGRGLMDIDLRIIPRRNFYVDNNIAFLEIRPDITIRGTERSLAAEGTAEIIQGDISYYNRTFNIKEGTLTFLDPHRLHMDVDITAVSYVRDYMITLEVSGDPEEELDFSLRGESRDGRTIQDMDVFSLLLTGFTTAELQSDDVGVREALIRQIQDMVSSMDNPYMGLENITIVFDSERGGTAFTLSDDLTRRLSTKVDFDIARGETYTRASFILRVLENISVSSFTDTEGHSGGSVRFEFERR
ncbi:translocation/assembly module TamB domain-containing protein [Chitinivibrio alkaliphilus]|uniref:Translocation and assembly module TamB C-terminal domain-containing protein n=1 Tax=Chitinivibrio alkaliphilus ACht1 TaxID=1313304 RepID=U7DC70_9BACT|nr:translocation/assembly module TamB domain-containing protein [Chitinivibrio alkaliphilus]ERP32015.1 hypothetical protein CALK_0996 [Chitinivibrio alkaliphilus ACht1]